MAYIMVANSDGRVLIFSENDPISVGNSIEVDNAPEEITQENCNDYIYKNGSFFYIKNPERLLRERSAYIDKLNKTDYITAKLAESLVTGEQFPKDDAARYADVIEQRKQWRIQINELDAELENVKTQLAELNKTS